MDVFPSVQVARFEVLEPGDLFLCFDHSNKFFPIKTKKREHGDRCEMVLLGPTFVMGVEESSLVPWESMTVLSFGKDFRISLPSDHSAWMPSPRRNPVWLALAGESTYICTNGGGSPGWYTPCYVDVKTGTIVEGRLSTISAYTNNWEIVIPGPDHMSRTLIKYPLESTSSPK